jgi:hypothetical protein
MRKKANLYNGIIFNRKPKGIEFIDNRGQSVIFTWKQAYLVLALVVGKLQNPDKSDCDRLLSFEISELMDEC